MRATPETYVFNHVPKTGGNSLLSVCRRNLAPQEISPHLTEHAVRRLPMHGFEPFRLITGHFSLLTQAKLAEQRYRMTLLRDPIRKIVSTYQFWRVTPEATPVTSIAKTRDFAGFVRYFAESPDVIHNPYTFHFAAVGRDCPAYPSDERALLAHAKRNLAAFDFIGITEQFDESLRTLCGALGWSSPAEIPHDNSTGSERLLDQIDGPTLDLLRERNRLDLELYEYGRALFRERSAGMPRAEARVLWPFAPAAEPRRAAVIRQVRAAWSPREPVAALEIHIGFEVMAEVDGLTAGVLVHDAEGRVVWGANTLAEGHRMETAAHRECRVSFVVDFEVPQGAYSVTVALADERRLGLHHHWIDDAATFQAGRAGLQGIAGVKLRRLESGAWDAAARHSLY